MRSREEEQVPLVPPSPTAFVRNSSLRTTRRYRLQQPPPTGSYAQPAVWAYQRSPSPGEALLQDRPPLPPPRNTEDILQRTNHDLLRLSQSYSYGGDSRSPGTGGGQHRRPPSPALTHQQPHCKDFLKKSHSLSYGIPCQTVPSSRHGACQAVPSSRHGACQVVPSSRHGAVSPPPPAAEYYWSAEAGGRLLPQDLPGYNAHGDGFRNEHRCPKQSSGSPILQRNRTTNILGHQSRPLAPSAGTDSRRGISSLFRSASPSLDGRLRPPAQDTSRNTGRSSWCHTVIARLQGRSLSSSPHRTTPPASPTTFRRVRHPSDTLPGGLRRYESLPIQKTDNNQRSRAEMEAALARERLSRSSLARQVPSGRPQRGSGTPGFSPWGEGAYMPWPLKPYTERGSHTTAPQHQAGTTSMQTISNRVTNEDPHRRRSVSLTASLTTCALSPEVEQEPGHYTDDHKRPRSSRIPREGETNRRIQSYEDTLPEDLMLMRSRRSRSLSNGVHNHQVVSTRGVHNPGFVSGDHPGGGHVHHSGSPNSGRSIATPNVTSPEVRDTVASPGHPKDTVASPGHPRDTVASPEHLDGWNSLPCRGSDSWPSRRLRIPRGPRDGLLCVSRSGESTDSGSARSSGYSSDGEQDVWEWFGSEPELVEESLPRAPEPCYDQFSFLVKNDSDYLDSLKIILDDYHSMCQRTPSHIRQHFDVFFRQMELIYQFQIVLHERIRETVGDVALLALVFQDEHFRSYYRCMVLTPTIQKELYRYSVYFDEHFPDLKRNILKPSLRINFYAMILDGYKKQASEEGRSKLQCAIDRLNLLKRQANTEMTIASVANSPVDLRLGGDMMHSGELFCLSGGSLQRKKYNMILFENLLVVTSPKMSFFKYKVHYRAEQVVAAEPVAEHDLLLQVLTEGQAQLVSMKFKAKTSCLRDQWLCELQKIMPQTAAVSPGESTENVTSSRQTSCKLRPLSLFSVHPQLLTIMGQEQHSGRIPQVPAAGDSCQQLIVQERKYVRQLSWLLHPDAPIPVKIGNLLEKLYNFHSKRVLPYLERSKDANDVLECFRKNLDAFDVYSEYLVVRCKAASDLDTSTEARLYISPVQHFIFYMVWLQQLCHNSATHETAQPMLDHFRLHVRSAQVRLLTETIVNGRVDFQRSGDIIRHDKMEVKTRKKELRGGLYFVLLFEKVVILTKPKPPHYEYAWDIWLDQVNLGPPTASDSTFKLEVRQGGGKEPVTYEFRTTSAEVKQEWLRHMQRQMLQQAKTIRRRTSDQ